MLGREADLSAVRDLLERPGLVTLLGPGGVGKSALALALGGAVVDLAGVALEEDVRNVLAASLGPTPPSDLRLLTLDNVEHAALPVARLAAELVRANKLLRVVVTSRERLRVSEERVFLVRPLGQAAALDLFWARAVETRPDLNAGDWRSEAALIVERLGGIPLAIELAVGRLRVMSPGDIVDRLGERFQLLRSDRRDLHPRHRSLLAAFEWSWRSLTESEQQVLFAVAVVAGDIGLPDVERITEAPKHDVPSILESLCDKSWLVDGVTLRGLPRFSLEESSRAYVRLQLEQIHGGTAILLRHDDWALERALALGPLADDGSLSALVALQAAEPSLLAAADRWFHRPDGAEKAVAILAALGPLFVTRGPYEVAVDIIDTALARLEQAPASLLAIRGVLHRMRGETQAARTDLERAVLAATSQRIEGRATAELGIVLHELGELDGAAERHERALLLARASGDRRGAGRALGSLAILHHEQGRADDAQIHYEQALAVLEEVGDPRSVGVFLTNLAELHREQGRLKAARAGYERALSVLAEVGDRRVQAVVRGNLGSVHHELGELDTATELRRQAIRDLTAVGDRRLRGVFLGALATGALERDEPGSALGYLEEAQSLVDAAGDRRHAGLFRAYLGLLEARQGHLDAARAAFDVARTTLETVGDPSLLAALDLHEAHVALAEARAEGRPPKEARDRLGNARTTSVQSDEFRLAVRLLSHALGKAPTPERAPLRLRVEPGAEAFSLDGADPVDLGKRKTLRLILVRLLSQRLSAPGTPLPMEVILDAGWPGERVMAEAAANRAHVAIATLRKLGLRDALASRDGGYFIDEDVIVDYGPSLP